MKLLLATNNPHKIEEYREILASLPVTLTSPLEEDLQLFPAETGLTFEENAILKAQAFAEASKWPVLADDSGLEVDALHGEPGVYSARYGHTPQDAHQSRYRLVLAKLAAKPNLDWAGRTGRFRCVIAVAYGENLIGTVEGTLEGYIAYEPTGSGGFGYDPIFYVPEYDKTLAELSSAQKHEISHRGRAARNALDLVRRVLE